LAGVVLAKVDERILLSEIGECLEHGPLLAIATRHDRGLQGRWGKGMVLDGVGGRAECVADACGRETVKLGDLARMGRQTPLRCASVEDLDGGDRFSGCGVRAEP
jgi:hypothetical protein